MAVKDFIVRLRSVADNTGVRNFRASLVKLGRNMEQIQAKWNKTAMKMTKGVTLPIAAFGGFALKTAADFESSMNILGAKSGAAGKDLESLSNEAKRLGSTTAFSASEAAQGMIEFAKAGLNTQQIISATAPALDLATASGMSLAEVATVMADTFAQFSLDASSALDVTDILSKASDSATTDVQQLSQALSFAGSVASVSGLSVEKTVGVLAALANTGIKSSRAGTTLANALGRLRAPSTEAEKAFKKLGIKQSEFVDKNGKLAIGLQQVFERLKKTGAGAAEIKAIFGEETARSLAKLLENPELIGKAGAAIAARTGNTAKQAQQNMAGLNGAIKGLKSAFEGVQIAIADSGLKTLATKTINLLTKAMQGFLKLSPRTIALITAIGTVVAIIPVLTLIIGKFMLLAKVFQFVGIASLKMWAKILLPVMAVIAAIGLLVLLIEDFLAYSEGRGSVFGDLFGDEGVVKKFVDKLFQNFFENISDLVNLIKAQVEYIASLILGTFVDVFNKVMKFINAPLEKKVAMLTSAFSGKSLLSKVDVNAARANLQGSGTFLEGLQGGATGARSPIGIIAPPQNNQTAQTKNEFNIQIKGDATDGDVIKLGVKVKDVLSEAARGVNNNFKPSFAR